jgi:hypothetical protein
MFPPQALEIIAWIFLPILVGVASVGGSGGGQAKVPILIILLNYSQQYATFLTYPILAGAAIANFFLLIPQRYPSEIIKKPLVDYSLTLILNGPLIFGA